MEPTDLVSATEGCAILGIGRARWYQLTHEPGFPAPLAVLACGSIYSGADIRELARTRAARRLQVEAERQRREQKAKGGDRRPVPSLPPGLTLP